MLKQRLLTALILVVLSISALFYAGDKVWHGALLLIVFIGAWEWSRFAKIYAQALQVTYAMIVTLLANFAILEMPKDLILWWVVVQMTLLIAVVWRYQHNKGQVGISSMALILLSGVLMLVPFAIAMVNFRDEFGATALLLTLVLIWVMDSGAYFSGRRFGKNKLANYVSPGKTWEGVYGGGLLSFLVAAIVVWQLDIELQIATLIFIAALTFIALFSVFGDLFESVMKRQAGLKDSGKILPGHGGVLDRIDSLLIAVPMFYVVWHYWVVLSTH